MSMIDENLHRLQTYRAACMDLPQQIGREEIINKDFLIATENTLDMYYAPHNEYINEHARIVIVGITPGWTQTKMAFQVARNAFMAGDSLSEVSKKAKAAARFSGTMRRNLIAMLDACGLQHLLGMSSSERLFTDEEQLLHTTSCIKYPVFRHGKNYNGHTPQVNHSPLLRKYAYHVFPKELAEIEAPYLLIPLGNAVSLTIRQLMEEGKLPNADCLFGFPHPSGANGHRMKQLETMRPELARQIASFRM